MKQKNGENINVINNLQSEFSVNNFNKPTLINATKISQSLISTLSTESVKATINSSIVKKVFPVLIETNSKTNSKRSSVKDDYYSLQNNEYIEKDIKKCTDQNNNNSESKNIISNMYLTNNINDNNSNKKFLTKEKNSITLECEKISSNVMSIKKNSALITIEKEQNKNFSLFKTSKERMYIKNNSPINFTQEKSCKINKEDFYISYNEQLQQSFTNNFLNEKKTNMKLQQEIKRGNSLFDNKDEQKWLNNFKTNICNTDLSINSKLKSTNLAPITYEIMQTDELKLQTAYYSKFLIFKII